GMGVVYKARQIKLNRDVALKMILSGQLASERDVKRFYIEAEAAANLDHPNIVPIYEVGEYEGQHYFSMAYVEGPSLAKAVENGPLPAKESAKILKAISEAMAYAHERGVIHRDLKPANVLLAESGEKRSSTIHLTADGIQAGWYEVRVTDFGLAKKTEGDSQLTATGKILGTPSFMPPEQASGKTDQLGPLADVYSLGAILYCLLSSHGASAI
ncbi:MAG: serine/threonine protein kinase, partial [Planctomycetaceae bacterium]|nr:serine/threonine protein kinase [Planctomycetaceae bacterium]